MTNRKTFHDGVARFESMRYIDPARLGKSLKGYVRDSVHDSDWEGFSEAEVRTIFEFIDDLLLYDEAVNDEAIDG